MRSLDHLTFGCGCDLMVSEGSFSVEVIVLLMCGAAI